MDAALDLFSRRDFDDVTVTEIVELAEVGRSTFFRYFDDKQDVLFADDGELMEILVAGARAAAEQGLGDSMREAMVASRAAMLGVVRHVVERYGTDLALRDQLIRGNETLIARSLLKQARYVEALADVLAERGATEEIATLAAHVALACYTLAHDVGVEDPARFEAATIRAFNLTGMVDDLQRASVDMRPGRR